MSGVSLGTIATFQFWYTLPSYIPTTVSISCGILHFLLSTVVKCTLNYSHPLPQGVAAFLYQGEVDSENNI